MKIAHVIIKTLPYGGGIEKYVEEIGPRHCRMGHEVVVYCMKHYGVPISPYMGMKVVTVPALPTRSAEKITSSLLATLHACLVERPDLIHFHSFTQQSSFVPRLFGIPVLVTGHGLEWKRSRWNAAGRLMLKVSERIMAKSASRITVVSRVQQQYLENKYGLSSDYVPTGVNLPQAEQPDQIGRDYDLRGRDYFLTSARLVPEKGIHTLIEAYARLKTNLKLVIAGDAGQEKSYNARLRRLANSNPNIIFTGFISGKLYAELMSNAYCFVLASELEGLPTVLLEAMNYGNCCLASDISENREALGALGVTFPSGSVAGLAERMDFLASNPQEVEQYRAMASSGITPEFKWGNIAERFHEIYSELTKPDRHASP